MPVLSPEEIFSSLPRLFYEVVPPQYRTYCVFTSQICQKTLEILGVSARIIPCQVWYASPDKNYVIGLPNDSIKNQWPGHVICMAEGKMIDAALHNLKKLFNVMVPDIVVQNAFGVASSVIGRFDLSHSERLWWHQNPQDLVLKIPEEPPELIDRYGEALANRITQAPTQRSPSQLNLQMFKPDGP